MASVDPASPLGPSGAGFRPVRDAEGLHATQRWWDANAAAYAAEHGEFLGSADFCWGPEGLREAEARLLGDVRGRFILEVGAGAAQCSRWLVRQGARVVAADLSAGMLDQARRLNAATGTSAPLVQADARALPFAEGTFDTVFTAYGVIPFVPDPWRVHREAARVLRPGGRWVFSTSHPIRWAFPDDPGEDGLAAVRPYFDRTPYVETAADGSVDVVEYHRTLGDHVSDVVGAGLRLERLVEPEWPVENRSTWGAWSPLRGALIPGTLVLVCSKDA